MKKILLLLAASLVLLVGCKKDGPQEAEPVADDIDDVIYKVICPKCSAMYFVTCKDPEGDWGEHSVSEGRTDWTSISTPHGHWEVKNEAGHNITFMQHWTEEAIQFKCQTQGCNEVMTCKKDDFKPQEPDDPVIPILSK